MPLTPTGIAYERLGPRGVTPVLLLHAGVADRRMWDPVWVLLADDRDVVRLDLRGFGDSARRPDGPLDHVGDVVAVLEAEGVAQVDVVGASLGAGVAVELALTRPDLVASLLLAAPGGSLLAERTADLAAFAAAEDDALEIGDLDAAAAANVRWWAVGPERDPDAVPASLRDLVHAMQRRAFELTTDWDDVEEVELDPPALDRYDDIRVPTTVLLGAHDLETVHDAAARLAAGVTGARVVTWDDVAHLPSLEQSERFAALVRESGG